MRKIKNIKSINLLIFLLIFLLSLSCSILVFAKNVNYNDNSSQQSILVTSLFSVDANNTDGTEKFEQAVKNSYLPPYLIDSTDPAFKNDYTNKGAVIYSAKNKSIIKTNSFVINDNTKDDLLFSFLPCGGYNTYYSKILTNGIESLTPKQALEKSIYPPIRDFTIKLVDDVDNNNFITIKLNFLMGEKATYDYSAIQVFAPNQQLGVDNGDSLAANGYMSNSMWGKVYDPFNFFYDGVNNILYADIYNKSSQQIEEKKIIRDFSKSYSNDNQIWTGFKGDTIHIEYSFAGGNGNSQSLFLNIDGLSLETDVDGYLLDDNVIAYNKNQDSYFPILINSTFGDGLVSYNIPEIMEKNLLGIKNNSQSITKNYVITVSHNGINCTDSVVSGLIDGKWTENTKFNPDKIGDYVIKYVNGDSIFEINACVRNQKKISDLLTIDNVNKANFTYDAIAPDYMNGWAKNNTGVKVRFTADSTINLNNVIDLRALDKNKPLISYLISPKKQQSNSSIEKVDEFSDVIIRLTDCDNEKEFIELKHHHSEFGPSMSFVTARANGQMFANTKIKSGREEKFDSFINNNGVAIKSTFAGQNSSLTSFYYDPISNSASVSPNYYDPSVSLVIRDFDDEKQLIGRDEIFSGFSSGKVKMSIKLSGLLADEASLIIYNINGQNISGAKIIDTTSPIMLCDKHFVDYLPKGEINVPYPLPFVDIIDFVDGNISDIVKKVFYDNEEITINDNAFIPTKTGMYSIVYEVKDSSENITKQQYNIEVVNKLESISISLHNNYPSKIYVGNIVKLPNYEVTGGSGRKNVEFYIQTPSNKILNNIDRSIVIDEDGIYKLVYNISDYLNKQKVVEYTINSTYSEVPIIEDITFPEFFITGKKYKLNIPKAYDYISLNNKRQDSDVSIYITETTAEGEKGDRKKLESTLYIPSIENGTVDVEYIASAKIYPSITAVKKYSSKIVNPKTMGEYFYLEKGMTVSYEKLDKYLDEEAIYSATKEGATMKFINPLPSNNFSISLTGIESGLSGIKLTLVDSLNIEQKVVIEINSQDDTSIVKLNGNGKSEKIIGSFSKSNTLTLQIKKGHYIYDKKNKLVTNIDKTVDGEMFNGFTTGKMYMTIEFTEILGEKASLVVNNLVNQPNLFKKLNDEISPFLIFEKAYTKYNQINTKLEIGKAFAMDIIDPSPSIKLTVTGPDGDKIYENVDGDKNYILDFNRYGSYQLRYIARDSSGEKITRTIPLVCIDNVLPKLNIEGDVITSYNIGNSLQLNRVNVGDNYTSSSKLIVVIQVIEEKTGKMWTLDKIDEKTKDYITESGKPVYNEFTFERKGKYILRYYVEDEFGNYVKKDYQIKVNN